jgi:hypothetical protein
MKHIMKTAGTSLRVGDILVGCGLKGSLDLEVVSTREYRGKDSSMFPCGATVVETPAGEVVVDNVAYYDVAVKP